MEYGDQTIEEFLSNIASTRVVPAGGTAAAVVGATGTALCEMACIHTVETEAVADGAGDLSTVASDLERLRDALLDLADSDARAVADVLDSIDTEDEDAAWKTATGVPLAIAESCGTVLEHAVVVTTSGNPRVVPDAVAGAYLVRAALQASLFTVKENLRNVTDRSFANEVEQRVREVEATSQTAFEAVMANVETGP